MIHLDFGSPCRSSRCFLLDPRVDPENTRRGELAKLVAYHAFVDEHRNELVPVVHCKRVSDEIWRDS